MLILPWVVAALALALLAAVSVAWWLARRPKRPAPLPDEWRLTPRPVFSTDERRMNRLLRDALPHCVVLAKLPLVRLCQPVDPAERRYWYELLRAVHVTFAICSANGRVLAAVDLDTERHHSRRASAIKTAVLAACRVRYLRFPSDQLPSLEELQRLVPGGTPPDASTRAGDLDSARDALATVVALRRAERTTSWNDSTQFHDSFFDSRIDGFGNSSFNSLRALPRSDNVVAYRRSQPADIDLSSDLGGVVVDAPSAAAQAQA
jgi:hypothetical protein